MSKRKRKRRQPQRQEREQPASPAPKERSSGRGWWLLIIAGITVAIVATTLIIRNSRQRSAAADRESFPRPLPTAPDTTPTFDDFVGSAACEECHEKEYDIWKESTHGNAGGEPTGEFVIAPFDGVPIQFEDATVTPTITEEGRYAFIVAQRGRAEQVLAVDWVVGRGHMVGGGTQAFFSAWPDGTVRFIPFDWSKHVEVWFCQTGGRTDEGWAPITPDMALADCVDWPPFRVLGAHDRFRNCQQCHGSQILLAFDESAGRYETNFTTLAINCESCHGPGRLHIEISESDSIDRVVDVDAPALETYDEDGSLNVCFQCHSYKTQLARGFISGKRLQAYFATMLPRLRNRPFFPDGRIRTFAYQEGHLYSDCYLNGTMTCVDCHDPHSQKYRDIWGGPLVGRYNDGQCLDCHASKAEQIELHTYHDPDSIGSRCVTCHMPFLQEPNVGPHIQYTRSDHTIPIPRPGLAGLFGIEDACQICHTDYTLNELQDTVRAWYGTLKPLKPQIKNLI
ncbi:MAG: multiheme c-type cytochrome, partial [Planctomycetota bacterium]